MRFFSVYHHLLLLSRCAGLHDYRETLLTPWLARTVPAHFLLARITSFPYEQAIRHHSICSVPDVPNPENEVF